MKKVNIGVPQMIIIVYLLTLTISLSFIDIPLIEMMNTSLIKWVMNGVLVLSLVPMINIGVGRNFGLPIGICAGLIGMCIAVELRLEGWSGFLMAIFMGTVVASIFGGIYSIILNKLKGNEEIVGTFAGFSFIPIMNIFWTLAPFKNRQMLYPVGGQGLRPKISLNQYFGGVLDNALKINIGKLVIPVGLLLFFAMLCLIVHLFFKTKIGTVMSAIAENEAFVKLSGVNINRYRTYAIIFSTILAAIGICVYSQSYGFVELYNGPFMMAFPAVSAILIGGATRKKATIFHALVGAYLYQTTFLLSVPVANALLIPEMSEVIRMIVTNSIILYAFLYEGVLKKSEEV
ncbi:ribose/xylose/arabinose/galactoside ABC-type transport system, permease component [Clostridium aceticum]|uniref:Ribose/xylose/arabinose/galactoside ABC-type transport system, permease component n=1 Tax=Clostridium aceticum TaxID=84022 RepID=A0A0D8I757_9CLOT|nr:ABC transporter [Clostridium aceticum]AKL94279.1 ribose/xylose/arabinose/galactoside ABC-type transport system, permease component [Clostridium aceticum]KJF26125.1 ABC transporter [Clostridium aceticum]